LKSRESHEKSAKGKCLSKVFGGVSDERYFVPEDIAPEEVISVLGTEKKGEVRDIFRNEATVKQARGKKRRRASDDKVKSVVEIEGGNRTKVP